MGDDVVVWSNQKSNKGIIGYGTIITEVLKPTQIAKGAKIYDRNNFQIGVHLKRYGSVRLDEHHAAPLLPASIAYQLPSFNEWGQSLIIANSLNYFSGPTLKELEVILHDYYYLFNWYRGYTNPKNYQFIVHWLREKYLARNYYKKYQKKLDNSPLVCAYCHTDFGKQFGKEHASRILELHEVIDSTSSTYVKINVNNFRIICPNCHKLEHIKMRHYYGQPREHRD